MYIPIHFEAWELVPPEIYEVMKDHSFLLLKKRLLISIDMIRKHFGAPVWINNYEMAGHHRYRGFRQADCEIGAPESQHRLGAAADFDVSGYTAEEVRKEILKHKTKFPYITRMESDVPWVHIDLRRTDNENIILFKP